MNVSLTPELEELINQKVKSGMYNSASEVIREGLRRLFKDEAVKPPITETQRLQMDELQREVMIGYYQIRNGESVVVDVNDLDKFADDIISNGMKRRKQLQENTNGNS
jgi:antitoxin ParD1/3/4